MTLRFHIHAGPWGFSWACYSMNNRLMFEDPEPVPRFRNVVNHVRSITQYMRPGSHCIVVTRAADELRRERGEPLYGVKSGVCQ